MNKIVDKAPLKTGTAWSHLRTLKRASEIVRSWPEWKRTGVVFRDRSTSGQVSKADTSERDRKPQRRSA